VSGFDVRARPTAGTHAGVTVGGDAPRLRRRLRTGNAMDLAAGVVVGWTA